MVVPDGIENFIAPDANGQTDPSENCVLLTLMEKGRRDRWFMTGDEKEKYFGGIG